MVRPPRRCRELNIVSRFNTPNAKLWDVLAIDRDVASPIVTNSSKPEQLKQFRNMNEGRQVSCQMCKAMSKRRLENHRHQSWHLMWYVTLDKKQMTRMVLMFSSGWLW